METQFPLFCFGWRGAHGGEGSEVFEASTTLHTCLVLCFIFHERDSHPKRNGATCASFDAFRWDWDTLPVFFSYPISSHQSNQIVSPFLHRKRKKKKVVDSWYKSILDIVKEHQEWLDQKRIIKIQRRLSNRKLFTSIFSPYNRSCHHQHQHSKSNYLYHHPNDRNSLFTWPVPCCWIDLLHHYLYGKRMKLHSYRLQKIRPNLSDENSSVYSTWDHGWHQPKQRGF